AELVGPDNLSARVVLPGVRVLIARTQLAWQRASIETSDVAHDHYAGAVNGKGTSRIKADCSELGCPEHVAVDVELGEEGVGVTRQTLAGKGAKRQPTYIHASAIGGHTTTLVSGLGSKLPRPDDVTRGRVLPDVCVLAALPRLVRERARHLAYNVDATCVREDRGCCVVTGRPELMRPSNGAICRVLPDEGIGLAPVMLPWKRPRNDPNDVEGPSRGNRDTVNGIEARSSELPHPSKILGLRR